MKGTTERGYGSKHQATRDRFQRRIDRGETFACACNHANCPHHATSKCPTLIVKGMNWDLGHNDDRSGYIGPECVPCNRSAGARTRNSAPTVTRWEW